MSSSLNGSRVVQELTKLKQGIPVNQELKTSLRRNYANQSTHGRSAFAYRRISALVAALLLLLGSFGWFGLSNRAFAAELQIVRQSSFLDLTSGEQGPPAVYDQQLYIPLVGKGIGLLDTTAMQSDQGLRLVVIAPGVDRVAISHDGKQLAYNTSSGVYLFNLERGEQSLLVAGNNYDVFYQEPSWSQDDQTLFATKETVEWLEHGHQTKSLEVMQVNLSTREEQKVVDGRSASQSPDGNFLIFERDGNVYRLALKNSSILPWIGLRAGEERLLCSGHSPSISPDGRLVALVRRNLNERRLTDNASVQEDLSDVFVVNLRRPEDQKLVTCNYPFQYIAEQDWLNSLSGSTTTKQTLVIPGYFSYYNPVWGSDEGSLYVLKSRQPAESEGTREGMRIMRVSLAASGLTPTEVAAQWLEAVVNRD